ncbi:MAG: ArsA family ATPase [Chloroflexota bacterium]
MRMLVYTGKGGTGKTTVAAATAVRCADGGAKTLLIGSDTSQSLADCLNSPLSDEPAQVAANLWAQEIDPLVRLERLWPTLEPLLGDSLGVDMAGTAVEELALAPGVGDLLRLLALKQHCDEDAYDVVVVDAGSSTDALQLLSYPEGTDWWLPRLLPGGQPEGPLARGVDNLAARLRELRSFMGDGTSCSIRLIMTAEQLCVRETQRALTFANLFGYNVDAIVLNRQRRVPRTVADTFAAWPMLSAVLYDREVVGEKLLGEMALALFPPPMDPAEVMMSGQAQRLARADDGYLLTLKLPFVHEDDIDVLQHHSQLIVQVGRMRRVLPLPPALQGLQAADAVLEEGTLEIHFQ